jgi:hypothetical protein
MNVLWTLRNYNCLNHWLIFKFLVDFKILHGSSLKSDSKSDKCSYVACSFCSQHEVDRRTMKIRLNCQRARTLAAILADIEQFRLLAQWRSFLINKCQLYFREEHILTILTGQTVQNDCWRRGKCVGVTPPLNSFKIEVRIAIFPY